jgi:hypothetical protein
MTDPTVDPDTPASPTPAPSQPHGDAFMDQSGSRHGEPPSPPAQTPAGDEGSDPAEDAAAG